MTTMSRFLMLAAGVAAFGAALSADAVAAGRAFGGGASACYYCPPPPPLPPATGGGNSGGGAGGHKSTVGP